MPKLPSSEDIVGVLRRKGFVFISQRGSHAKFRRHSGAHFFTVIVPMNRKEIPIGTFSSILKQSGLIKKEFE